MENNVKQDKFNKLLTVMWTVFAMGVFVYSFLTHTPVDGSVYGVLVAPIITHISHLLSNKVVDKTGSNGHG